MAIIQILDKLVLLDLKYEKNFININKYIKDGNPSYKMITKVNEPIKDDKTFINETKYTKEYILSDNTKYVVHKNIDGNIIGTINYVDNQILINLIDDSFNTEYLLSQYGLVYIISKEDALLMHGSSLRYKNKGIIFTAPSGTGKSTHSRLWQKYADCEVINDDKNILLLKDDKLYLYPSPWSGKHHLDNNIINTLDYVIFLYQNKTNVLTKLKPIEAFKLLLTQLEAPSINNKDRWNKIVDKILELPIYRYGCNMEYEAFKIINEALEEKICQ